MAALPQTDRCDVFSACGPGLQEKTGSCSLLNKEEQRVPPHIRIFAYLLHPTDSTCIRQSGLIGIRCTVQQHGRSSRYRESYSMVQLHTEFGEERFGSLEVVDNDENVVHP